MIKKINELGVAIVPVLIGLAIVGAGTVMILNLQSTGKKESAVIRSISMTDIEKKRILTALSDNNVCKKNENFGNQPFSSSLGKDSLETANGDILVEKFSVSGKTYGGNFFNGADAGGGSLRVASIILKSKVATPTPKDFELVITYSTNTSATSGGGTISRVGKGQAQIVIPMYVKLVSNVITDCYAITDTANDIDTVVTQACSPATANANRKSILNLKDSVASECVNQFNFQDTSDPLHIKSLCGTNLIMNGFTLTAPTVDGDAVTSALGNSYNPSPAGPTNYCLHLPGVTSNSDCSIVGGQQQVMHQLTSSAAVCKNPGTDIRESPTCAAGDLLWKNADGSVSCVTVNCPVTNEFVQAVSVSGVTCYKAPATTCGANQYVAEFKNTGSDVCKELPVISGGCSGTSSFGTSIKRVDTTAGGTLNCTPYNKAKACPTSTNGDATFAYSFNGTTTASCTQW